ncbi:reverse transcriptase domain-containing protein [Tanacetum coccineum]
MSLELADKSIKYPRGIAEDVLIKIDKFILPVDFVILDMREDSRISIILGRPFLATARAMIDVFNKKITLRVGSEEVIFDVDQSMKKPRTEDDECYGIDDLDTVIQSTAQELLENDHRNKNLEDDINRPDYENSESNSEIPIRRIDHINTPYSQEETQNEHLYSPSAIEIDEKISELKDLPSHLEYAYLEGDESCLVMILSKLTEKEKTSLLRRRLNPKVQDVVKDEIVRLLDSGLIYPILDRFFQILIVPEDQEKTTFTCPYGTFAYKRMPFGLCNAPTTFQRCMTAIFHDMVEDFMEVFMDDFSVFVGAVLGQRIDGKFKPIYYASKTLNDTQAHYTTTKKELLVVVFSFDKFHPYLILSKTVVYIDHSALKYLFRKQEHDAKPRLIRWVLLLQGFNIEIKDKKGAENLVVDHLLRLENLNIGELAKEEIKDKFPDEHLMILKAKLNDEEPWYADYINYIVGKVVPPEWTLEKKKRFFSQVKNYFWDDPHAFRLCPDNVMRRCVAGIEILEILAHCHSGPTGGHHSASVTGRKVYESGFYWPSIFRDAKDYVFDIWGLDFMGPFPDSRGNKYILFAVDYMFKWVKGKALPTNDTRVVVKFLKGLFARFRVPKALLSDRGTHFCNSQLKKALLRYGVTHRISTAYHPQTNGQIEVTNRSIKRILERSVGYNPKYWSEKLNDALWAFRTAYKTSTGCTPFRMVYGKACHIPVKIEHKAYWTLKQCNTDLTEAAKNRFMDLNELMELRDGAMKILKSTWKKLRNGTTLGSVEIRILKIGAKSCYLTPA